MRCGPTNGRQPKYARNACEPSHPHITQHYWLGIFLDAKPSSLRRPQSRPTLLQNDGGMTSRFQRQRRGLAKLCLRPVDWIDTAISSTAVESTPFSEPDDAGSHLTSELYLTKLDKATRNGRSRCPLAVTSIYPVSSGCTDGCWLRTSVERK